MKKFWTAFGIGLGGVSALILASGYGFIFKAIAKNLTPKPLTPSIDDAEQFDYHWVETGNPLPWDIDEKYNHTVLPEEISKNLEETKASALLVVKNGRLIHDQYWNDHTENSLMNSFSMAKGILAMLVGAAIKEGKIKSENQLFSDFYPEYAEDEFGKFLTLKHLMQMQAGLDWAEEYHHPFAPNSKQYFVEDLAKQVFERKLKEMPGKKYEYQSAAPQLLGFALRKAVGKSLAQYLSEKLWIPLGMEHNAKWSIDAKGMEKAFCCIHAAARDFAKIGQLILQNGKFSGTQVIGEDYLQQMLCPSEANDAFCYTVWADEDSEVKHRFFYGFLGQFIIVIPSKQLVIVKTGHDNNLPTDDKLRPLQVRLLSEEISNLF